MILSSPRLFSSDAVSGNNYEILLRYSLELMRPFFFAQPFLFSSRLFNIIHEYAERPEDVNKAMFYISHGKTRLIPSPSPRRSVHK